MKKITKKLALRTETIRVLDASTMSQAVGGSVVSGTSVLQTSGTSVISSGTSVISVGPSGTSVISGSRH